MQGKFKEIIDKLHELSSIESLEFNNKNLLSGNDCTRSEYKQLEIKLLIEKVLSIEDYFLDNGKSESFSIHDEYHSLKSKNDFLESQIKNADERYKKLSADHEKAFQKLCDRGKEINTLNEGMEKMASENERLQSQVTKYRSINESIGGDLEKVKGKLVNKGIEIVGLKSAIDGLQKKVQALEAAQSEGNIARLTAARIDAEKKLEAVASLLESFKQN